jgi:16S rRNA (adenine1518-N6/adenine1519-N6)-dimethyltransferase
LSQHFLRHALWAERIADAMGIRPGDTVLEIGPGDGALTQCLVRSGAGRVVAVELDRRFIPVLQDRFGTDPRFCAIQDDFLKVDLRALFLGTKPIRVTGNIPYTITSPILFRLLEYRGLVSDFTVTVQKEVAERLVGHPGTKAYGIPSVFFQLHADVEMLFIIPRGAFFPVPEVDSAVLRVRFRSAPVHPVAHPVFFESMVKAVFNQRRKMLRNTLKGLVPDPGVLDRSPVDLSRRPETLSVKEFALLADALAPPLRDSSGR